MRSCIRFQFTKSVFSALFLFLLSPYLLGAVETFHIEPIGLTTSAGVQHQFNVEIADTAPKRELGLMYRKTMAADEGMLFVFETSKRVRMWMKNTFLPLDMLFLDKNMTVVGTFENAVPLSEEIIDTGDRVDFVLELNAGTIKQLGIKQGDTIQRGERDKKANN